MKKRILPILCAACLLVSCGGESVTFTLPKLLSTMSSDKDSFPELQDAVKKTTNSDGSITYELDADKQKDLLDKVKKDFEETKNKLIGNASTPNVTSISANSDFSRITIETKSTSLSTAESILSVALISYCEMYGIFSGKENYKYSIEFVNEKSGEVLKTVTQAEFKELTDKLGSLQDKLTG